MGGIHGDHISQIAHLRDEAGGSLNSVSRTLVGMLHDRGTINVVDKDRLIAILDVWRHVVDPFARLQTIEAIHQKAAEDGASTPAALGISSVAVESARRLVPPTIFFSEKAVYLSGEADLFGAIYGTLVLPGPGTLTGIVASSVATESVLLFLP